MGRPGADPRKGLTRQFALLDFDCGAGLFELGLDRVGLVLGDALLDRLRRRVDEILRLLQPEAGDRTYDLDHLDFLAARAGEYDVERGLLLGRRTVTAAGRRAPTVAPTARLANRPRSGSADAPTSVDLVLQHDEIEHGHLAELVEDLV